MELKCICGNKWAVKKTAKPPIECPGCGKLVCILRCRREDCKRVWQYKGKSKFYASCPNCRSSVRVVCDANNGKRKTE